MTTERHLHVVVADSDAGIQQLLAAVLQRQGWKVTTTGDVDAVLDLLGADWPDVLVIEPILPGRSGLEVLEWIDRTNSSWLQHVLVLTTSLRKVLADLTKIKTVGCVMGKPFDIAELVGNVAFCAETSVTAESQEPLARRAS